MATTEPPPRRSFLHHVRDDRQDIEECSDASLLAGAARMPQS